MAGYQAQDEGLPEWFLAQSPLSMDPIKGPDEQYQAGARDMWALVCQRRESGDDVQDV